MGLRTPVGVLALCVLWLGACESPNPTQNRSRQPVPSTKPNAMHETQNNPSRDRVRALLQKAVIELAEHYQDTSLSRAVQLPSAQAVPELLAILQSGRSGGGAHSGMLKLYSSVGLAIHGRRDGAEFLRDPNAVYQTNSDVERIHAFGALRLLDIDAPEPEGVGAGVAAELWRAIQAR